MRLGNASKINYEKNMAAAKKTRAAMKDLFRHGIEERVKALKLLATARPGQVDHVILDTPFLIWAHPDGMLDSAVIKPLKSFATFEFEVNGVIDPFPLVYDVEFWFFWQNDYDQEVMINAETLVTLNGFMESQVDYEPARGTALIWVGGFAGIEIHAGLDISVNNTSPLPEQGQYIAGIADTDAEELFIFVPITFIPASSIEVLQTANPTHNGFFIVPKNASVVFDAFVSFAMVADKSEVLGSITQLRNFADFSSQGAFVQCPFVHLEVMAIPIIT
jgi:hypothetical protein